MYRKLAFNDIKKSKLVTAAITAFILLAALLTSAAASLLVNLFSSIGGMTKASRSPDLVYMHAGEIDYEALDAFAWADANVTAYQVSNFLNIEGNKISLNGNPLTDSVQDNGFASQNESFDFTLNMNGEPARPQDGEVYVPVYYMLEYGLKEGDPAVINGTEYTTAGFVRDTLFNPSMASAKRFIVSQADYEKLEPAGRLEYLVEFRFSDKSKVTQFMTDYLEAGMPSNGPPGITQNLLTMMNAISDGIMIAVLMLISLMVVAVTFLCVRLTLLSKIEDDYREIGVLKAIGLRVSGIKKLYLAKYGIMSGMACVMGFLLGLSMQGVFMANIRAYFGQSGSPLTGTLVGAFGAALIFLVVILYVNGTLNRFRKISASQAIRFGQAVSESRLSENKPSIKKTNPKKGFRLSGNNFLSTDAFLGVKAVLSGKKLYATMLAVIIISAFILVVPRNLYDTVSSGRFMTTMGIGLCDMLIVVQQTDDITGRAEEISQTLNNDPDVAAHAVYTTYTFSTAAEDGTGDTAKRVQVTLGDHSAFPIEYSNGRMPENEKEIALSAMLSDGLGKTVGDEVVLQNGAEEERLTVCGIYSDVTNAGSTSKAMFTAETNEVWQSSVCVTLKDESKRAETAARYKTAYPFAKVADIDEYTEQSVGSIRSAVRGVSYASVAAAMLLTVLITLLFMKMLTAKERYSIAVLKACGFTSRSITRQYFARALVVLVPGVIVGTLLANTLGELVGVALISSFGATSFSFDINPLYAYVFSPLLIAVCVFVSARLGLADIGSLKVSEFIRE